MNDLIIREWNGKVIRQREDGYLSATDMCQACGKKMNDCSSETPDGWCVTRRNRYDLARAKYINDNWAAMMDQYELEEYMYNGTIPDCIKPNPSTLSQ